jgi:D-alanyl-D-alanine carboxypeptidase (penicillin-binding protein 5/6)
MIPGRLRYDGVINGKTGWTVAAQHTLITAARRDGRTLIAVVLRAANINDRRTDTIALLNYGFDKFHSISFTAGELSRDFHTFAGEDTNGIDVSLSAKSDVDFLIHESLSKEAVTVEFLLRGIDNGEPLVSAVFFVSPAASPLMFTEIGRVDIPAVRLQTERAMPALSPLDGIALPADGYPASPPWYTQIPLPLIIVASVVGLLPVLRIWRHIIIIRRRKRRKLRLNRRFNYHNNL